MKDLINHFIVFFPVLIALILINCKEEKHNNNHSLRPDLMKQPGIVKAQFLFTDPPFKSCHASTIVETEDFFIVAYFAGTGEGNEDVGIWVCRKEKGKDEWSKPVEIVNGIQFSWVSSNKVKRYPCWNPVLYQSEEGTLLLFYKVGPSPDTWWGMLTTSEDQGMTWSEPKRLPEGIIGPVRAKPVRLPGGSLLCGSSTEHKGWQVHMEFTPDLGKTWSRTEPLNDGRKFSAIQPTILIYSEEREQYPKGRIQILCRSRKYGKILESWSEDGGKTWSPLEPTILPNPSAGIDAVTLDDGRQLLVYNHSSENRSKLNVAVSIDGKNWNATLKLEDGTTLNGKEAYGAYPGAIQAQDGLVHITYTWRRERINYVVIDPQKIQLHPMHDGKWSK